MGLHPFIFKRIALCLGFVVCSLCAAGQNSSQYQGHLDSLLQVLTTARAQRNDTMEVSALNALAEQIWGRDPDSARTLSRKALVLAEKVAFVSGQGVSMTNIAYTYLLEARYRESREMYEQALVFSRKAGLKQRMAWAYHGLGNLFNYQGLFEQALESHTRAAKLREEIRDLKGLAWSYNNIGHVYEQQHLYDEALEYRRRAIELFEAIGFAEGKAKALGYAADILLKKNQLDLALDAVTRSLRTFEQNQLEYMSGDALVTAGNIYLEKGQTTDALNNFNKALTVFEQIKRKSNISATYNRLAEVYLRVGHLQLARLFADKAMKMSQGIGSRPITVESYNTMARIADKEQNAVESLKWYKLYSTLKDSVLSAETNRNTALIKEAFESERKDKEIQLNHQQIERSNLQRNFLVGVVLLVFVLGGLVVYSLRKQQHANRRLGYQRTQIMQQNQALIDKNEKLNTTLDELRNAQNQLIKAEKLASLGQLIANIAHEINTPLGVLRTNAHNLQRLVPEVIEQLPTFLQSLSSALRVPFIALVHRATHANMNLSTKEERAARKVLESALKAYSIHEASERASALVSLGIIDDIAPFLPLLRDADAVEVIQKAAMMASLHQSAVHMRKATDKTSRIVSALKSYTHVTQNNQRTPSKLQATLDNVLILHESLLKQGVEVVKEYDDVPEFLMFPDELEQVWSNMIHNAILAMRGKGRLELSVQQESTTAVVRITDSGNGIPPEVLPRIFEPLFTTRPKGQGSGLGLDICKKIIEKHDGTIEASSVPGRTQFTIRLPMVAEGVAVT